MNYSWTDPYIIAEVGSNWNRFDHDKKNLEAAKDHVFDAVKSGASAVKFQYFSYEDLYGLRSSSFGLQLQPEWLLELSSFASEINIDFMCSAFSVEGYEIVDKVVSVHKVASCEMKHIPIIRYLASTKKPVIISTAGHNQKGIDLVLNEFAKINPAVNTTVTLLECVGAYPAMTSDYNLSVLNKWKENYRVGISDHTLGNTLAIASVGFGATVFEKHFDALKDSTLRETADSPVSIGPDELTGYVNDVYEAYSAIGNGDKAPTIADVKMVTTWHRRLIVSKAIKRGDTFKYGVNFGIYRSTIVVDNQLWPEHFEKVDGMTSPRDYEPGEVIENQLLF